MKRRILEVGLGLLVVVAIALTATLLRPMALPRLTEVEPPRDQRMVCVSPAAGTLYALADDGLELAMLEGSPAERPSPLTENVQDHPFTLRGVHPSGGVLIDGAARSFVGCQLPVSAGAIQVYEASTTELRIVNPDATDAAVNLSLYGPEGEVLALGSRGIVVGPQQARTIALSVLAARPGPVGVSFATSRGRVAIAAISPGGPTVVPSQVDTHHLIPGVAAGAKSRLVVSNPGLERATVEVHVLGANARFQPAGGAGVSLAAGASLAIDLTAGIAGEAAAVEVSSDQPVGATVFAGKADAANAVPEGRELRGFGPEGGVLQLSNPGEQDLTAVVTVVAAGGEPVEEEVAVPGGTTVTRPLPDGGSVETTVSADAPLVGALAYAKKQAVAAIPLQPDLEGETAPIKAELVPTLR